MPSDESSRPVALITGAGSGVGRACAVAMAEAGWSVALVGRRPEALEQTAQQLDGPERSLRIPADLTDAAQANQAVDRVLKQWGRLDALLNIAGYASMAPLSETTDDDWQANLQTNLSAVFYLVRAAWPAMVASGHATVVVVSSMASIDPFPGFGAYAPAKAAVNMLVRIIGDEGAEVGIRSVALAPGAIETPMLRGLFDEKTIGPDQTLAPEQVARRIRDMVLGELPFENGQVIPWLP